MSSPGKYDLILYRGDSYSWRFQLWEDSSKTEPVDLTGATVAAEFRDRPGGATVVSMGCVITTPNIIDMQMTAAMWVGAPPTSGAWDLEVTFPSGEVRTFVAGKVVVTADVTHSTTTAVGALA